MKIYITLIFLYIATFSFSQDDCGTAISISYGSTFSDDNLGATADNDYSGITGCSSAAYSSSHWYTFSTPAGVSSINLTFTSGTIGGTAVITLVDDCSNTGSYNYIWSECDANSISGSFQTICNLIPNTDYYIQIGSEAADEGTFDLLVQTNPLSPANDICVNAIPIPTGPVLECMGGASVSISGDPNACPDPEATGCMSNSTPGVWYFFDVLPDFEYNMITFSPQSGATFELFSAPSGCGSLTFEACHSGTPFVAPIPGMRYYILLSGQLLINPVQSVAVTDCNSPWGDLNNGGTGTGGTDIAMNSCVPGDPTLPCENDNVIFYDYVVGCVPTDLTISIEQWTTSSGVGAMIDGGIMAIENDCSTLMSQYDVNGTGFVCSGIVNNEELILNGVPGGTQFFIVVGSDNPDQGYFEITVNESSSGGSSTNDLCSEAITVVDGDNTNFTNVCATSDLTIPGCSSQSASTVWFYYDPGSTPQDITINLNSTGINSPAIAAWEGCNGGLVDSDCSNLLELFCIDVPIYIEIGSSVPNEGTFDLNISSSNSLVPPGLDITPLPICSYENTDLSITIEGGNIGDIIITQHSSSPADIMGQNSYTFQGVNTVLLDDILVNCSSVTQSAVYEVSVTVSGFNCQASPILIEIPVFPKLDVVSEELEFCLPAAINLDAGNYITGGGFPYQTYNWLWNGSTSESTTENLNNYQLLNSGYFDLEVTDANGCNASTTIDIIAHDVIFPFLSADVFSACINDPQFINVTAQLQGGGLISNTIWTLLDQSGNGIPVGIVGSANTFIIPTNDLLPGIYIVEATVTDENGCENESSSIEITIYPQPAGAIEVLLDPDCNTILELVFYGPNGEDIYGNGPDSNNDGIPDQFDLDNNGIPDFSTIEWLTPSQGANQTNELIFEAYEEGIYSAEITTVDDCLVSIQSPQVSLVAADPPSIMGLDSICLGDILNLVTDATEFVGVEWLDDNNNVLSTNETLILQPQSNLTIILEAETIGGCIKSDSIDVVVLPDAEVEISGSTSFCPGDSTIISGIGNLNSLSLEWYKENQLISTASEITLSQSGAYKLIAISEFGCTDTFDFNIIENDELDIQVPVTDICDNDSIILNAGPGFDGYLWTNIDGDSLGGNQMITVGQAGIFVVEVSNGQCLGSDTVEVAAYETPNVNIPDIIQICNNQNLDSDTLINFNLLIASSDTGSWDVSNIPTLDIGNLDSVSFSLIDSGSYNLIYTTTGAQFPCINQSDTLIIEVSDCDCPYIGLDNDETICVTDVTFDLNSILLPGTELGTWSQTSGPQTLIMGQNSVLDIENAISGNYVFAYVLDEVESNCEGAKQFVLTIENLPTLELVPSVTICNQESTNGPHQLNLEDVLLNGTGDWIDPNISGLDFTDLTNLDFTGITPGEYLITFLTNNANLPCINVSADIEVQVIDCSCPLLSLEQVPDLCNDSANLNMEDFVGSSESGSWQVSNLNPSLIMLTGNSLNYENASAGQYSMIYTLNEPMLGCPDRDTVYFNIYEAPNIEALIDSTVCNIDQGNGDHILDLNDLVTGSEGEWLNPDGSSVVGPNAYDFTTFNIGDVVEFVYQTNTAIPPCIDINSSAFVSIKDCNCIEPVFDDPPLLCNVGEQSINLDNLIISSNDGYWIIQDPNIDIDGNVFNPDGLAKGTYQFTYVLESQPSLDCQTQWLVDIEVNEQFEANVESDQIICTTNFNNENTVINLFNLISNGYEDGIWLDETNNQLTEANAINFLNEAEGSYFFTYLVENELPCLDQIYEVEIIAEECSEEYIDTIVTIGNIFSPNGDAINDVIFPKTNLPEGSVKTFLVYDRWGNKVYHGTNGLLNDPQFGWDGKLNGKYVSDGVYVYFIEILFVNGKQQILTGDITIVK